MKLEDLLKHPQLLTLGSLALGLWGGHFANVLWDRWQERRARRRRDS